MFATFKLFSGNELQISTDPLGIYFTESGTGSKGTINVTLRRINPTSITEQSVFELGKPEARAIASAIMGAAAELP